VSGGRLLNGKLETKAKEISGQEPQEIEAGEEFVDIGGIWTLFLHFPGRGQVYRKRVIGAIAELSMGLGAALHPPERFAEN
jgi:hypothetical protein